jgi:hypothetical protein
MSRSAEVAAQIVWAKARQPDLASALFGGGEFAYGRYRLVAPILRSALSSFLHALEAAALVLIFDPDWLYPILSLRLFSAIGSGFLWGATEAVRQDIRTFVERAAWDDARRRYEEALGRGLLFAAVVLCVSAAWVLVFPAQVGVFSVIDAYALVLGVRLALSALARVVHAGPGALRRVPRPPWSMFVPDLLDGLGLFLFWRWAGPWSVALAVLASSVLNFTLSVWYSKRAVDESSLRPQQPRFRIQGLRSSAPWLTLGVLGLAFSIPHGMVLRAAGEPSALFWYSFRPLASLVSAVPMLYYVDLVRVRRVGIGAENHWVRHVRRAFSVAAVGLLVILETGRWTVDWGIPWYFPLVLGVFSWSSAFLFQALLRTLTRPISTRSAVVVVGSLLPSLGLWMAWVWIPAPLPAQVLAMSGAVLLGAAVLDRHRGATVASVVRPGVPLSLVEWLESVPPGPVRVGVVEVSPPFGGREASRLARLLAADSRRHVTRIGRRLLLVAEPPDGFSGEERVVALAGWALERGVAIGPFPSAALQNLAGSLPQDLRDALWETGRPELRVESLERGRVGTWGELPGLVGAAGGGQCPRSGRWGEVECVAWVGEGGATQIRLLPLHWPAEQRRALRRSAWQTSIQRALARLQQRERAAAQPTK